MIHIIGKSVIVRSHGVPEFPDQLDHMIIRNSSTGIIPWFDMTIFTDNNIMKDQLFGGGNAFLTR